jgi:hypothetical protein
MNQIKYSEVRKGDTVVFLNGNRGSVRSVFTARDGYSTIYFKEKFYGKLTNHFNHDKLIVVEKKVETASKK